MPPQDEPRRVAADVVGAYFLGEATIAASLTKICHAAVRALPGAAMAGIALELDGMVGTHALTHPAVAALDRPQHDSGEGPCADAMRSGKPVVVASARDDGPYPAFRRCAVDYGLLSAVAVPLRTGLHTLGVMNLYSPVEHHFSLDTAAEMRAFTAHAALLLLNQQGDWDARSLSENLDQAMRSRAEIEQAKGIVMASTGCTPQEALASLRDESRRRGVKLRDLAAEIVQASQRLAQPPTWPG